MQGSGAQSLMPAPCAAAMPLHIPGLGRIIPENPSRGDSFGLACCLHELWDPLIALLSCPGLSLLENIYSQPKTSALGTSAVTLVALLQQLMHMGAAPRPMPVPSPGFS